MIKKGQLEDSLFVNYIPEGPTAEQIIKGQEN